MAEQPVLEKTRTDNLKFSVNRSEDLLEAETIDLDTQRRLEQVLAERGELPDLPMQLIEKYADIAVRRANLKQIGGGKWFATIPGFQGVWASESTPERTLDELEEVVRDWTLLKIQHKDNDLPILEEIDLNGL